MIRHKLFALGKQIGAAALHSIDVDEDQDGSVILLSIVRYGNACSENRRPSRSGTSVCCVRIWSIASTINRSKQGNECWA